MCPLSICGVLIDVKSVWKQSENLDKLQIPHLEYFNSLEIGCYIQFICAVFIFTMSS